MYKLIAIDLDDTLLTDERQVSEATKQALKQASERGVRITIATGRMHASAVQVARQLELNVPIITYQGALIKTLLDDQVLYERYIPEEAAKAVIDYAEHRSLHLQAYYNDTLYSKFDNDRIQEYSEMSKVPYTVLRDFHELPANAFTKMLFFEEPDTLDRIREELPPAIVQQTHVTKSKPYFLEIMHTEGTKGHAVAFLAAHVGCDLSEVIAIGDSWNDHEMIETAGVGVAMGNAVEPLKQIADYITADNNHDGIRQVIEQFVL